MFYDLHIHSALSPCADDEMTCNNIINMAIIKGLECIAVCDHNSTKQQGTMHQCAQKAPIKVIYGVEIQSEEEVHILAYFKEVEACLLFQNWISAHQLPLFNDVQYFGNQWILNELDQPVEQEKQMLLASLTADLKQTVDAVHQYGGKAVLAHVLDRVNSVTTQLGFIPENLNFDGLEIKSMEQKERILKMHPWIKKTHWFINSDAHQLIDISENENYISDEKFRSFWGETI